MRVFAIVNRIIHQMFRDKRTLALLFIAPLFIITLMYYLFNGSSINPKLGLVNIDKNFVDVLEKSDIDIKEYDSANENTVIRDKLDGLLKFENNTLTLTLENSTPSIASVLKMKVTQLVNMQNQSIKLNALQNELGQLNLRLNQTVNQSTLLLSKSLNIQTDYIYGNSNTTFFDSLSITLIGFFVFFFVFLISGIGLLRERVTGTLERLLSTPIKRWEIVIGYLIGYGLFAVIQTVIIVLYSINVLNISIVGSIWNVFLINFLLALIALSLGILLSAFASSEFQMMQFIPIVIVPQIFFAGIFPIDSMPNWMQTLSKLMPLYYGSNALKSIMYKGFSLSQVKTDIFILILFTVIFTTFNIFALKKYRKL